MLLRHKPEINDVCEWPQGVARQDRGDQLGLQHSWQVSQRSGGSCEVGIEHDGIERSPDRLV